MRVMLYPALIIGVLCIGQAGFAQQTYHPAKPQPLGAPDIFEVTSTIDENIALQYTIRNLGIKEGLPNTSLRDVFIDSRHLMWLSTYGGGLCTYDGIDFVQYTIADGLAHNQVFEVTEDQDGNIWIATDGGVDMYDGQRFIHVVDSSGLGTLNVWSIVCDRNNAIWIGTANNGVFKLEGDSLSHISEQINYTSPGAYDMLEDSQGRMWFGNVRGGASMWDGDTLRNFAQIDIPGWGFVTVRSLFEDSRNNVWIGTIAGAVKVSGGQETFYSWETGMADANVGAFYEDPDGLIWMGTLAGVSILHPKTEEIRNIGPKNGLYGSAVYEIIDDDEGNIWIANSGYGLAKYEGDAFTHIQPSAIVGENGVTAVFVDTDESFWFASRRGLHHISNGVCTTYDDDDHQILNNIYCISRAPDGQLWLGTETCFARFYEDHLETYTKDQNLVKGAIYAIEYDGLGRIWAGGRWGISVFANDTTYLLNEGSGMPHYLTNCMKLDDSGNMWIGTFGGGLCMVPIDSVGVPTVNNPFRSWIEAQGFGNGNAVSLCFDEAGNLWATAFGMGIYIMEKGGTPEDCTWHRITQQNGLADDNVLGLRSGLNGAIWAATGKGMSYITIMNGDTTILNFGFDDGFLGIESSWDEIAVAPDHSAWFATVDRATNYNPLAYKASSFAPVIQITDIKLFQEAVDWNSSEQQFTELDPWYFTPRNLVLDYNHNHITFDFQAISYNNPTEIRYQWMLENYDVNWNPLAQQTSMTYPYLPAGNYTFRVKALGANGVWSEERTFTFTVLPPFWQTWWFRGLALIVMVLIIRGVFKIRTRALKKRQHELEQTVQERTEEIREQKHIVEEKNQEITDSITYAKRIQEAILPPTRVVKEYLPNSFVLYKPKDIVAGDFYWMDTTPSPRVLGGTPPGPGGGPDSFSPLQGEVSRALGTEGVLFAAADCTGHGVPGAMVSVVCHNAMNRAVREFGLTEPGLILDKTRELVVEQFEKSDEDVKDGMDIALCSLSVSSSATEGGVSGTSVLQYAGANNPLWIIRDCQAEPACTEQSRSEALDNPHVSIFRQAQADTRCIMEVKPTKQPIGKVDNPQAFQTHTIELQKGDTFYIFSDGYVDQFGGEKGKKFKASAFRELLLSIQNETMDKQRELINEAFESWRGELEQIDDVCVIGVRIANEDGHPEPVKGGGCV